MIVATAVVGPTRRVGRIRSSWKLDPTFNRGPLGNKREKESSFCILCGLCVRYCAEVKKKNAVGFVDFGARREIRFIPEIASKECNSCKECFPLCPTSYLQAAFVLAESQAFPRDSSQTELIK